MMRALFSGVSGLKVHQTKMDVIGNNISNVNTVGFKSSSVTFTDVLYQTTSTATGPSGDTGRAGQNAMQIGLGAGVSAITTSVSTSGGSQRTDNPFDLMIEGESFFVVNNGSGNYFTKAGSFTVDANGTLCNASGYAVMGWQVDPNNPSQVVADNVSPLHIMGKKNLYIEPEATKAVHFSGNIDSADTAFDSETGKLTSFSFYDNLGRSYTVNLKLNQLIDSNGNQVNNQYSVAVTDVLDSNGKSILVAKEETGEYAETGVEFSFGGVEFKVETNGNEYSVTSDDTLVLSFDARTGNFASIASSEETISDEQTYNSVDFVIATAEVTENPFPDKIDVDFSTLTMFANSGTTSIEPTKGSLKGLDAGYAAGNMKGVSVDALGMIYGVYDNGMSKLLGQIVVAKFSNPTGLESVGGSLFTTTQNSGEFDGIGQTVASCGGTFKTGVLEMSNVDLSTEFTNMITTQRGFQANSRIITTSDTLLEELINLKR